MSSALRREEIRKDIPDIVIDPGNGKRYLKGRFLGKVKNDNFIYKILCLLWIQSVMS